MGPWPLPQNFNGPFRKLMGHIINPMGHSLHAFFGCESCATDCHCIFLASFHTHYTTIDKSTDHGDDINPGIDPESETQNESQMLESNNKTTETESERSERWQMSVKYMLHHFKAYISRINNMHSLLFLDKYFLRNRAICI
jgi:hypothetical protein